MELTLDQKDEITLETLKDAFESATVEDRMFLAKTIQYFSTEEQWLEWVNE